ncbi:phage baseplate assembly protein V [Nonomuraea cavernae]
MNPPGSRSDVTAPRVTTPCRSSSTSACAWARWAASAAGDGSSHHRPPTVGGPVLLGSTARRRRVVAGRCAGRPDPSVARSGASVSPDT